MDRHISELNGRAYRGFCGLFAAVALAACGPGEMPMPVNVADYKADLDTIARARILFGHQSVGRNVLKGLAELSREADVPLQIAGVETANTVDMPGLFHVDIGKNREPMGKIDEYSRLLQSSGRVPYDAAILKFCYEDLSDAGMRDPVALVDAYAKGVAVIRQSLPKLRLVHATVPLRSDPSGWKTPIKRLIGRATEEDAGNQMRAAFNIELRKRFAGQPLFDIAEIESTLPSNRLNAFMLGNESIPTLAAVYTNDGGHLNALGQQKAAMAFVRALASALRSGG